MATTTPPKVQIQVPSANQGRTRKRAKLSVTVDEKRLQEITDVCVRRLTECRNEMGVDYGHESGWALCPIGRQGTWAWTRQLARVEYANNFAHREALGGVWLENNWSLNVPARFVKLLASKYADDLVGTDPFFAAMPEKMDDPNKTLLCKQVEKKIQYEVGRSNLGATLRESIRVALIEGERPIKLTWEVDKTQYVGTDTVMVGPDGKPMVTKGGEYIYKNDYTIDTVCDQSGNFLRDLDLVADFPNNSPAPVLQPGEQLVTRLEKDPTFVMPGPGQPQPVYALVEGIVETIEHKNGLRADGMFCEDFIYPIYSAQLSDSDIMAHCYDCSLDEIAAKYGATYVDSLKAAEAAGEKIKYLNLGDSGPLSTQGQALLERGEGIRESATRKILNIHETYYRCRVKPTDKYDSWLFIVIDFLNQRPIYAEFLGNMNMKRPPFAILRGLESQPGRAYGVGVYEKWYHKSLAVDLCFNRLALKSSKSASATFVHKEAFAETKAGEPLVLGGSEIYTILSDAASGKPFGKDHPPIFRVNLAEVDEWTMPLMEKIIQSGQLEFGIVSAADGSSEDLNSSKTATGIRNIERTGNVIQRSDEALMTDDMEEILELVADIVLQNMDETEEQFIPGENKLATLSKDEVLDLPKDVRLLLTKAKSGDGIAPAQQIISTIQQYYEMQPALRKKVRPAFIQILKDLYVPDADERLDDPTEREIAAAAAAGSGPKASELIGLKGTDLAQNQKDALLEKDFGLPAAQASVPGLEGVGGPPTPAGAGGGPPPPTMAQQLTIPAAQSQSAQPPQQKAA